MTPELNALFNLHRYQILLNAKDHSGEYQFPHDFLFAVACGIYPHFNQSWCVGDDPYLECYSVEKQFILDVLNYVDGLWLNQQPIPSFHELEDKFGQDRRHDLVLIFRYCFLHKGFDADFYKAILSPTNHPIEASGICAPFSDSDLMLL